MNTTKLSNLLASALVLASAGFFVAGCSSEDDTVAVPDDDTVVPDEPDGDVPGLPDVAPPPPASTINGIWEGDFSLETTRLSINYDVSMLFNRVVSDDTAIRGNSAGVALGDGPLSKDALTENPHFLFFGGFTFSTISLTNTPGEDDLDLTAAEEIVCYVPALDNDGDGQPDYPSTDGGVWAVGRFGTQGSFLQEFAYDTGSAAGPDQRGAGCLYYSYDATTGVSKLTGEVQFEEATKLFVDLTYSPENARTVAIESLALTGEDGSPDAEYHLWSNDNSGTSMSYTRGTFATANLAVVENSAVSDSCGAQLNVLQVETLNLFTANTVDPHVTGCNVDAESIIDANLPYVGLGALADANADGVPEYFQLMRSTGSGAGVTAHALFNVFNINYGDAEF
jgi:hypothetical protein